MGVFSGTYNLGQLSLNGTSSVEVLRGSSSVQYGAEGIGGAVMLRSQPRQKIELDYGGWLKSFFFQPYSYEFNDSGWDGTVATSLQSTDNEQPYSQFNNQNGSFHLSRRVSENLKFDLLGLGNKSDINYPGNIKSASYPIQGQFQEIEGLLLSPGMNLQLGDWEMKGFYSFSEDNLVGKDSFSDTTYEADTNTLDFQVGGAVTEYLEIIFGGLYEKDTFFKKDNSTNLVDIDKEAESESIFTLATFSFGKELSLTLGTRHDDFSDYGSASTWSALLEKDLLDKITLLTRYSTSFSPRKNDLYGMWGNPNLNPEKADSWEVGVISNLSQVVSLRLSYFDTEFEDLIEWSGFTTANVGSARSKGVETSMVANRGNYETRLSFSYLDAVNSNTSERLLRRPRILGDLVIKQSSDMHTLGLGLKYLHDVMDIDGATFARISGDDYAILRLFGDYQITDAIKLFGRIENLMDEDYEEVDGYPALGRAIYAGLGFTSNMNLRLIYTTLGADSI